MSNNLPARIRRQYEAELYQRSQERADISHQVDAAEAQVAGLHHVAQMHASQGVMTGLLMQAAEQLVPEMAASNAMVRTAVTMGTVQVMSTMFRRRY